MKNLTALLLAATLVLLLTACGKNTLPAEDKTSIGNTTTGNTTSETITSPTEKDEPSGALPPEFVVMIYSESSADFHIGAQKTSATDMFRIEFDNYAIEVNKRDNNELQCSLYRQSGTEREYIGDCTYLITESETIINVPTVVLGIEGYNFNTVSEYSLYDGNKITKYSATEVALNQDGTPADIIDESGTNLTTDEVTDTASANYVGVTFVNEYGDTLVIDKIDNQGYPTAISYNGEAVSLPSGEIIGDKSQGWRIVYRLGMNGYGETIICDMSYAESCTGTLQLGVRGRYYGNYEQQ